MRCEYKSTNIKFRMDDKNQRKAFEYLKSPRRGKGSYSKILSDALVEKLEREQSLSGDDADVASGNRLVSEEYLMNALEVLRETFEEFLEETLNKKLSEYVHGVLSEATNSFSERLCDLLGEKPALASSATERITGSIKADEDIHHEQEPEISEDMIGFAMMFGDE